jgi:hypothetical protein
MVLRSTAGQIAVNNALPPELRDWNRVLDKKGLEKLLHEVASKHPEKYADITHALSQIGHQVAYHAGGYSFGLRHLLPSAAGTRARADLLRHIQAIHADPRLPERDKEERILLALREADQPLQDANY